MDVSEVGGVKVFKCLNCGFIFKTPKIEWSGRDDLNPRKLYAIAPEALYIPRQVCPKCGSDALQEVEIQAQKQ